MGEKEFLKQNEKAPKRGFNPPGVVGKGRDSVSSDVTAELNKQGSEIGHCNTNLL
ncbi:hypothetical protein ES703_69719 [subsurface metagenome]